MDLLILKSAAIFLTGFAASFIGTTTGGVGLILVPALIFLGLSPHGAIATARYAIFAGGIVSLHQFHRAGKTDASLVLPVLIIGLLGGIIGSYVLLWTPGPLAQKLLGIFILLSVLPTIVRQSAGISNRAVTAVRKAVGYVFLFVISILSAYFSAATGLLGRSTLMEYFGQTYLQSAATRKVQNLAVGIAAVLIYAWNGIMDVPTSLMLVPAVLLGSYFGSRYALKKGDAWARKLFVGVVLLAAMQLLLRG